MGFINTIQRFLRGPGSLNEGFTGRQTKNKSGDLPAIALYCAKDYHFASPHPFVTVFAVRADPTLLHVTAWFRMAASRVLECPESK